MKCTGVSSVKEIYSSKTLYKVQSVNTEVHKHMLYIKKNQDTTK